MIDDNFKSFKALKSAISSSKSTTTPGLSRYHPLLTQSGSKESPQQNPNERQEWLEIDMKMMRERRNRVAQEQRRIEQAVREAIAKYRGYQG